MQSVQELVRNIVICLPLPVSGRLFPVDVEEHLPLWALLPLSSWNLLAAYSLWAPPMLRVPPLCFAPYGLSTCDLREREQTSRFRRSTWKKIVLPDLASMEIIYSTTQPLSCWDGLPPSHNFSVNYTTTITFSFVCITKLNREQTNNSIFLVING